MVRFFLILLAIALVVWFGHKYFEGDPNGRGFWNAIGESPTPTPASPAAASPAAGAPATPTPTPTFTERVKNWKTDLWGLTTKAMLPLDSKDFAASDIQRKLEATERNMELYKPAANYANFTQEFNRLAQACGILQMALQERQTFVARMQRDQPSAGAGAPPPLSTTSLQPAGGLSPSGVDNTTFFRDRVLKEWSERCATYYQPTLNALLMGAN